MRSITVNGIAATPSKVICIGRNYVAHIEELGNEVPDSMVVFLKPNSAIGDTLHAQREGEPLHYEGEIAFSVKDGELAGVGFGLDLTRRQLQSRLKEKGLPWERAKAFDGAALFSDFVPLPADISALEVELRVDGQQRQRGGIDLMMFKPADILAELKTFTTLEDGDIIMTGTPAGVGEVVAGERFDGAIFFGEEKLVSAIWIAK